MGKWLPQKGKRVEVRNPATGQKVGLSEHAGFWVFMIFAVALIVFAVVAYG